MNATYNKTRDLIKEKQLNVLSNFNLELMKVAMFNGHDPLDDLLSMELDEVLDLVREAYEYYIEEEECTQKVAKAKALEEVTLWYYGNEGKELNLRERVNEL
ncbi:hypothetical protein AB1K89_06020 [Sporosarcina sp. 179-K 8C2 HS]|uniref:hypothetical protein n=1 Tax=Sporosarcina sp. 179-K 8C2 HS TaxID=3142387 RepID=UPI0039A16A07